MRTISTASNSRDARNPNGASNAKPPAVRSAHSRVMRAATGLSLRLGLASALVVSVVIGAGAFFAYQGEREQVLDAMNDAALTQGRLVLTGLKSAMLENNRTLLTDLIQEYARSSRVEQIHLLDATGRVALSTDPEGNSPPFELPADFCPMCPIPPEADSTRAEIIGSGPRSVMRSITFIANEPRCHRCHPEEQKLLGGLWVDFSLRPLLQARAAIISRTVQWGAAVCILVLLAVGAVVQFGALRRLRRLRDAARSLSGRGDIATLSGKDEIGELAGDIESFSSSLRQSTEELDFQRRFFIDLIDRMDDGVAVFDKGLNVVAANKSYLDRIAGSGRRDENGTLSCAGRRLCLHNSRPAHCPTRRAFITGELNKGMHSSSTGSKDLYYEVFASPMIGEKGEVYHVVEVWRDISERVRIDAQLLQSERLAAVGVLASGFSHEISTPLGTIAASIQGILRRLDGERELSGEKIDDLREGLELASSEVFRCRDITRSLLDLSREKRSAATRFDASRPVLRMLEVVRPAADSRGVKIVSDVDTGVALVSGHADQIEQLMLNLYVNAIEAMPGGGTLSVTLHEQGSHIEISVTDTGEGMPEEHRVRVFEPFFSNKSTGSGLGLYLSRKVVEAYNGEIEVAASGECGTCMRVRLPRATAAGGEAGSSGWDDTRPVSADSKEAAEEGRRG